MNREAILEALNWRYAVKKFDPSKKIADQDLNILMESLRLSPSSFGLQYWEFVLVKNKKLRQELVAHAWNQKQVEDASDLIILCRKTEADSEHVRRHVENMAKLRHKSIDTYAGFEKVVAGFLKNKTPEQIEIWMKNQVYIALGFLMQTCALLKIDCCPMEGFIPAKFDEVLQLDQFGLKSVLLCPVGYRASDDKYATEPKVRFAAEQVIRVIE